jgi:hypothetical protein
MHRWEPPPRKGIGIFPFQNELSTEEHAPAQPAREAPSALAPQPSTVAVVASVQPPTRLTPEVVHHTIVVEDETDDTQMPWKFLGLQSKDGATPPINGTDAAIDHGKPQVPATTPSRGPFRSRVATTPSWNCPLMARLAQESSPAAAVMDRWAKHAAQLVTEHVRKAFVQVRKHLESGAGASCCTPVALMALAGADVSDHDATMQLFEEFISKEVSHIAHVEPDDFRSLAVVTRRICSQLMREPRGRRGHGSHLEREPLEAHHAGLHDFVEWFHTRNKDASPTYVSCPPPAVLLIRNADVVPKDVLRDLLSCFGTTCSGAGIPTLIIFGLRHSPQTHSELLEGRPTVAMQFRETLCLLDEEAVVRDFIEYLASDAGCPFAVSPKLLIWLRDQFMHTSQSVTHMLCALALVAENALSKCPFAVLCEPLDKPKRQSVTKHSPDKACLDRAAVETLFLDRLRDSPQECKDSLLKLLADNACPASTDCPLLTLAQVATATAEAFLWRQQLCRSLAVWDELLCVVQPLARHQVVFGRVRRLEHLLSLSSPFPLTFSTTP